MNACNSRLGAAYGAGRRFAAAVFPGFGEGA